MFDRQRFIAASEAAEGWAKALVGLRSLLLDENEPGQGLDDATSKLLDDPGIQSYLRKISTRHGRIETVREWATRLRKERTESWECLSLLDSALTAVADDVVKRVDSSGTTTYDNAHQAVLSLVSFVLLFIDGFSGRIEAFNDLNVHTQRELLSLIARITLTEDESSDLQSRIRRERATLLTTMEVIPKKISGDKIQPSPDYRSMRWGDIPFRFTSTQAACIGVLFEAWKSGSPDVGQAFLLEKAGSNCKRLRDIFKGSDAWNKLVIRGRKGAYRLADPK